MHKETAPQPARRTSGLWMPTTVSTGASTAPSCTVTSDIATGDVISLTYTTLDTRDNATCDPDGTGSSLKVNDPGGTSYEIVDDDSNQYPWSTRVDFYSRPNKTGTLYNWDADGSQLHVFVDLLRGDTAKFLDYSQPNVTGRLLNRQYQ